MSGKTIREEAKSLRESAGRTLWMGAESPTDARVSYAQASILSHLADLMDCLDHITGRLAVLEHKIEEVRRGNTR